MEMEDLQRVNNMFLADLKKQAPDMNQATRLKAKLDEYAMRFHQFDLDGSGDLDLSELQKMLVAMSLSKTEKEVIQMVNQVDDDNTGTIRYREFVNLMLIQEGVLNNPIDDNAVPVRADGRQSLIGFAAFVQKRAARGRGAVKKQKRGHLKIEVSFKPGTLTVTVQKATDLLACDLNGLSDPYVKMYLLPDSTKATKHKTKVIKKSLNPTWNESFDFNVTQDMINENRRLHITVWDWDRITANDFMGAISFTLDQIINKTIQTSGWFKLLDEKQGANHAFPSNKAEVESSNRGSRNHAVTRVTTKSDHRAMKLEDFTLLKVLGRGSFGKVFLAEEKSTKKMWALKALKKFSVFQDDDVAATMTERRVLSLAGKPNFLTHMHAGFQTEQNLFFVMELITGGDLMHHVLEAGQLSEKATRFYIAEICCGLWALHTRGILYRDLKLDNVMIDHDGHVKLADFGLAKEGLQAGQTTHTFCGTPDYIAPEIIQYLPYNASIDWWSLGVMMYEMLTGEPPFDGDTEDDLFNSILTKRIRCPRYMKRDTASIIAKFLIKNHHERLTQKTDIQNHPYFKGMNWDDVQDRKLKPPFRPKENVMSNFDSDYLKEKANITPTNTSDLAKMDQRAFHGFTYVPGTIEEHSFGDPADSAASSPTKPPVTTLV